MKIEFDTIEELQSLIDFLGSLKTDENVTKKRAMSGAERTAKCRANKKTLQDVTENVTETLQDNREKREEEREEKEAVSPLSSPLPFSPNTPYPIPPIIPPSQEKEEREGEKKERDSASAKSQPAKNRHGEYQHVLLTADEFFKLQDRFGWDECEDRIRRLDEYLENNRKKHYDSHYLTILNWARKDEERKAQPLMKKPQQKSWLEVAREIDAEEKGEVVDL